MYIYVNIFDGIKMEMMVFYIHQRIISPCQGDNSRIPSES